MRRRSFLKRHGQHEEVSLQITSMADIFMILLVFLLKSLSSGAIDIAPSKGTKLPIANINDPAAQALKVEISQGAVLVEGQPAMQISDFRIPGNDVEGNGVSKSLVTAFEQQRAKESGNAANHGVADPRIIVIADQHAPYQTIKTVLASAAVQGYTDVKLAVEHAD